MDPGKLDAHPSFINPLATEPPSLAELITKTVSAVETWIVQGTVIEGREIEYGPFSYGRPMVDDLSTFRSVETRGRHLPNSISQGKVPMYCRLSRLRLPLRHPQVPQIRNDEITHTGEKRADTRSFMIHTITPIQILITLNRSHCGLSHFDCCAFNPSDITSSGTPNQKGPTPGTSQLLSTVELPRRDRWMDFGSSLSIIRFLSTCMPEHDISSHSVSMYQVRRSFRLL